jgi:hypothetical protein
MSCVSTGKAQIIRQTHPVTFVNVAAEKKTGIAFCSLSAEADWAVIETLCELPYLYISNTP